MMITRSLLTVLGTCLSAFATFAQPAVLPGDYPDPSVTKIGKNYWASATTSNWFPAFPLLKSTDLVHWQTVGTIFNRLPEWADYYFWAPEITEENGKVYVYYTAHRKGGNLCVAVASADRPEGPYRDHGPLVGQPAGSIDGFPMRDQNGKLYLIWKEDGNSVNQPTPIWAQPMNEDRTALTGERRELFRNDTPWEGNLVEGVSMIKHGDYYYALYAASACCGAACTYGTGVARAKTLLGPWEKFKGNPVLTHEDTWRCPGHGTAFESDGKFFFLFHAYDKNSNVYTGRQGLLKELRFTADGWIAFEAGSPVANRMPALPTRQIDTFKGRSLSNQWQWSVFQQPSYSLKRGALTLQARATPVGSALGQRTLSADYIATTTVNTQRSQGQAGVAALGDDENALGASVEGQSVILWKVERGKKSIIATQKINPSKSVKLRLTARQGHLFTFAYSTDGNNYQTLNTQPVEGAYLPPWDRAVRVGVVANGSEQQRAIFEDFGLELSRP